ncbi:MAG: nucleotide sugar dehydrogenase [bacterium]|nr:nucleotide sugar dehydrogenase [bacterium]
MISIIGGCGHIGLPLGVVFSMCGKNVNLVDIDTKKIECIKLGNYPYFENDFDEIKANLKNLSLNATNDKTSVQNSDVVIWAFPTFSDKSNDENIDVFINSIKLYEKFYNKNQLFIIRSTIQMGAFDKIKAYLTNLFGEDILLAYCPERISESNAFSELKKLPQIVAANNSQAFKKVSDLFSCLSVEIIELCPEEAEMSKLMLNAWRYMDFAISNSFYMLCQEQGLDFYRLFNAVKKDYPRANDFKKAGLTAGPCLTKDTKNLIKRFGKNFEMGSAAIEINSSMPSFLVYELINKIGSIKNKKILVLGSAFKANCDDKRGSLAFKVRDELLKQKAIPVVSDIYDDEPNQVEDLIDEVDAIILTVPHKEYENLKPKEKPYVDCWGFWE